MIYRGNDRKTTADTDEQGQICWWIESKGSSTNAIRRRNKVDQNLSTSLAKPIKINQLEKRGSGLYAFN